MLVFIGHWLHSLQSIMIIEQCLEIFRSQQVSQIPLVSQSVMEPGIEEPGRVTRSMARRQQQNIDQNLSTSEQSESQSSEGASGQQVTKCVVQKITFEFYFLLFLAPALIQQMLLTSCWFSSQLVTSWAPRQRYLFCCLFSVPPS